MYTLTDKKQQQNAFSLAPKHADIKHPVDRPSDALYFLQRNLGNSYLRAVSETDSHKQGDQLKLQTKLEVGSPDDVYEQEADRVAEQILAAPANPAIIGTTPSIQRYAGQAANSTDTAPASVDRVLAGSGRPLEPALRQDMEQRFGRDFSQVRMHTGAAAEQSARDVNANAYTVGHNVVFGAGRFEPETHDGRRLIAHELTHVVQQGAGGGIDSSSVRPGAGDMAIQRADSNRSVGSIKKIAGLEHRIEQLEGGKKRDHNMWKAAIHFNVFREKVLERVAGWELAATRVGSAYALAAEEHSKALDKRAKAEALETQALFSVLTIATAGGLSWLSGTIQAGKAIFGESELLTNVLEDTIQAAVGETFSATGPLLFTPVVSPVSINPQLFQNERVCLILSAKKSAHAYFAEVNNAFLTAPPEFWDTYNEKRQTDQFNAWLNRAGLLKDVEHLPNIESMALELERGFWAKWVEMLTTRHIGFLQSIFHFGKQSENDPYNLTLYKSPGSDIEKRLSESNLGITREAGIDDFGRWTSEIEIDKLAAWGRTYKVKPFIK